MDLLVDHLRSRPGATTLVTSIATYEGEPDDAGSPLGFYVRYGFRLTDQISDGERVMELDLSGR